MIYKYILPHIALNDLVESYLITHLVFENQSVVPIKPYAPKPEQGITFFVRGSVTIADADTGILKCAPKVSIFGQQTTRCNFQLTQEYLMIRVHFKPGGLFRLLGIPMGEFTDQYIDAASILRSEVEDLNNTIAEMGDYSEMVRSVENYLIKKRNKLSGDHDCIDAVAALMLSAPGKFSLDYFANQACLSPRQFNRRFSQRMGTGPKRFSSIVRFFAAYRYKELNPLTDWLSIAVLFEYHDYQHLVRDFKEFAGVTPKIWMNEDRTSPEKVFGLE